jgi:hypothetical protein
MGFEIEPVGQHVAKHLVEFIIFPTSVGANPMQSIYTFAKIFVDRLIFFTFSRNSGLV